jgi:predicted PurR-regulated permease PerM
MQMTIKKTIVACSVITVFLLSLYLIFLSKTIILYLIIAIILVIAINPLVSRIEKYKIKKIPAVLLSDFLLLILLICFLSTIIIPLIHQGSNLIQNLPDIIHNIINNPSLVSLSQKYHFENNLNQFSGQISSFLLGGGQSIIFITSSVVSKVSSLTIVLVLTFLLQIEGKKIWMNLLGFLNKKDFDVAQDTSAKISKAVSGFVSGNLFISLIAGIVTFITLMILNVPYAFALAALVAFFDLIPLIGAAIATIVVGLVALTKGLIIAIIAVVVILTYQFIESHFIQPIVYSKSISISALIIVIASVFGAEVGGIIGILLAIPIASVFQIIITEFYLFFKNK